MNRHRLAADEETTLDGRVVVRAWCECDRLVIGVGASGRAAWRAARRGLRDHAGAAAAGGAGWEP